MKWLMLLWLFSSSAFGQSLGNYSKYSPAASPVVGSPVLGGTTGSVLFIDGNSKLAQNNANFFWNDTSHLLGLGTSPVNTLDAKGGVAFGTYAGVNTAPSNGMIVSGTVGIGTNTTGSKLEVNGTSQFDGDLTVGASGSNSVFVGGSSGTRAALSASSIQGFFSSESNPRYLISRDACAASSSGVAMGLSGSSLATAGACIGLPNASSTLALYTSNGTALTERARINSSGNLGIGTTTPHSTLEVNGGAQLNTATARPTCSSTVRGLLWVVESASGVTDNLSVCLKAAADTYSWVQIITGG